MEDSNRKIAEFLECSDETIRRYKQEATTTVAQEIPGTAKNH